MRRGRRRGQRPGESRLGLAILGLLEQAPRSGYDLRKTFVATPMGAFSDSPGAIYPALHRLAARGWVRALSRARASGRRRQLFELAPLGRRALLAWLRAPVTREDVVWGADTLMLRFAFMGTTLAPRETVGFLESLAGAVEAYLAELTAHHAQAAASMPLTGRLALERGIDSYRALARWTRRAAARIDAEGRKR